MINWNKQNNALLEQWFLEGKTDIDITALFFSEKGLRTGTYAVAKQRSNIGLVKTKRQKGLKRQARRVLEQLAKPFYAIYYRKDGLNHFSFLDTNNPEKAVELARHMIYNQRLSTVTIMQPVTQLVCEKITTIKL